MARKRRETKRFFSRHAEDYSRSLSHATGPDLAALIEALEPAATDLALDVATGTGFTAVSLAGKVKHVTGIDLTGEMLEQARQLARDRGISNVTFEIGDALEMEYADASFNIVATRRATHHFEDVSKFIGEARRVLKPGGRLGVVDMSPPEGAEAFTNRIERLRDGSHVKALSRNTWESMTSKAGFRILSSTIMDERVAFEKWLYPVEPGGKEERAIRAAWRSSSENVRELLKAEFDGEDVKAWVKSRIVLVASKTP